MKNLLALIILALTFVAIPCATAMSAPTQMRQEIAISEPTITGQRGSIVIACPVNGRSYTFQIYAITGQLLKKVQLTDTTATIVIPQGCYIVKCESWIKKVIVQ